MTLSVLGLIPARGGSKGVRRKNLRLLHGKSLLAYTAEAAHGATSLTHTVLSTEDAEITGVGRQLGLDVIPRPQHLARDETPMLPVVRHALAELRHRGQLFDAVCLLQPTNPLRQASDIDRAVELLMRTGADSVIAFVEVGDNHPARMRVIDPSGRVSNPPFAEDVEGVRRQDLPPLFLREGSIYLTRTEVIEVGGSFQGEDCRALVVPPERACNIDTELDLRLAHCLLEIQ